MSGWWSRASSEQKLAQVDAGIELGMTARQVAIASGGASTQAVLSFAFNNGRGFRKGVNKISAGLGRQAAKKSAAAAYFRGESVDLWRNGPQDRSVRHGEEIEEVVLE